MTTGSTKSTGFLRRILLGHDVSEDLRSYFYKNTNHPYRIYEKSILDSLSRATLVVDAGCGRTAPVLSKVSGKGALCIGIDLEPLQGEHSGVSLILFDSGRHFKGDSFGRRYD